MGRGLIIVLAVLFGFAASAHAQTAAPPSRFANWTSAIVAADWRDGPTGRSRPSTTPGAIW